MGFKPDSDLRRPAADPYLPANVGAMGGQFAGTGTLMVEKSGGGWEYGEEAGIDIVPNACFELPCDDFLLYWSGIEVRVKIEVLSKKEDYFVVAALEPVAWGWCLCAPLRREYKHSNRQRDLELRHCVDEGQPIQKLTWDPFLRDKGKYAARLNDPMRLHYDGGDNLGNGLIIGRAPRQVQKAVWHFGICSAACLESLGLEYKPSTRPRAGAVRVPRTLPADRAQAALWYACAGRGDGETTFQQMRTRADRMLKTV